jgi:hypothetical protein
MKVHAGDYLKKKLKKIHLWNLEKKNREVSLQKHHFCGFWDGDRVVRRIV